MKTGSKKQYRKARAWLSQAIQRRESASKALPVARMGYEKYLRTEVNHLDPLISEREDEAVMASIAMDQAEHDLMESEASLDKNLEVYEEVCAKTGINPRLEQFIP